MKILTTSQMQQIEEECAKIGLTTDVLMENAGKAVAEEVRKILGNIDKQYILFLIGPGNNGGDGLVAARHLHDWGAKVSVYLLERRTENDQKLKLVQERSITCVNATEDENMSRLEELLKSTNTVIDAIFGTGLTRRFSGLTATILGRINRARKEHPGWHIIALDLPSGLNADTGEADTASPYADYTITLGFPKPGLFKLPGAERVGKLTVVDIGMPAHLVEGETPEYIDGEWVKSVLPERPLQANKGSFGRVLVVAGSINYIGAAYLACSGAIRVGAGLVTLATATSLQPILASKLTEVTYFPLPESRPGTISAEAARLIIPQFSQYKVLLLGCGLGQNLSVTRFIKSILLTKQRQALPSLVLDADALNTLANTPRWWQLLTTDAILTPHPGEMARLTGMTVEQVQSDRAGVAKKLAADWNKTIVLKGANTVIASPQGKVKISLAANPGLASAGTGDVLTGAIAGLVAQGLSLFDAAACGVYLHAEAGEMVKDRLGDAGMIASDLLVALPQVIKWLKEK
jgi:NAD(P)H-hydrate epimerase